MFLKYESYLLACVLFTVENDVLSDCRAQDNEGHGASWPLAGCPFHQTIQSKRGNHAQNPKN